jgi:trigger factor
VEVTIQDLSEVSREVEIKATPEELQPHFNKAYADYRKKVEIRGFRKGKAPVDIVKKLYGDLIEHDSLESIAPQIFTGRLMKEKESKTDRRARLSSIWILNMRAEAFDV